MKTYQTSRSQGSINVKKTDGVLERTVLKRRVFGGSCHDCYVNMSGIERSRRGTAFVSLRIVSMSRRNKEVFILDEGTGCSKEEIKRPDWSGPKCEKLRVQLSSGQGRD
jgi:ribosomal protein L34E